MKHLALIVALMCSGCKHDDGTAKTPAGPMPGSGNTVVTNYSGTIDLMTKCGQTCRQTVSTNANVFDYPNDAVYVFLCRNTACTMTNLPAQTCAQTGLNGSLPCYTTIPSTQIVLGTLRVDFINAFEGLGVIPGYSNYAIQTVITR